jgi:hypothetical protein
LKVFRFGCYLPNLPPLTITKRPGRGDAHERANRHEAHVPPWTVMAAGKDDESTAEMPALDAHESYGSLDTSNSKPSSKSKSKSTVAVAKMTSCVCDMPVCGRNKWTVVLVVDGKDDTVLFGAGATNNMCAKPFGEHHGKVPTSTQMGVHQKGGACFSAMTTTRHGRIPKTETPWPRPVILLKEFDDCAALMIDEQRAGTANHGIKWGGDALGWLLPVDLLETDVQLRNALKGMVLKMYTKGGGDKTMTGGSPQWQLVALTGQCQSPWPAPGQPPLHTSPHPPLRLHTPTSMLPRTATPQCTRHS